MLNGIDPVIIFQFNKKIPNIADAIAKIPVVADIPTVVENSPIPIYLSEAITGILIDSEDLSVDIQTDTETKSDGKEPTVQQKGIASTVSINMEALKDNLNVVLLSTLAQLAFEKCSSQEYFVSYLHGSITIFRGQLTGFSINQNASSNKVMIKVELTKGSKQPQPKAETLTVPAIDGLPIN